jgi:hypothetical protein
MPLSIYAARKDNSGAALFVSFNSKEQSFYFELMKQTGWNAEKDTGVFKGGQRTRVKFSMDEVGDMMHAISNKRTASFYHKFEKDGQESVVSGKLSFYSIKSDNPKYPDKEGFGLTVKSNVEYKVGLSYGVAEKLKMYLTFGLNHCFSAIYSKDKKDLENRLNERAARPKQEAQSERNTPTEPEDNKPKQSEGDDW